MSDEKESLYSTDDYYVVVKECRDANFSNDVHMTDMYAIYNRETGVCEREAPNLPATLHWADGLQAALDEHREAGTAEADLFAEASAPTVQ